MSWYHSRSFAKDEKFMTRKRNIFEGDIERQKVFTNKKCRMSQPNEVIYVKLS